MVAAASQGLGFAIASALAAEGAKVSIAARKQDTIAAAAARIAESTRAEVIGTVADVSSVETIEGWHAATVKAFGGVDILVTISGGPPAGPASGFEVAAWKHAFD
ncbi:MAG: short-chain dehydrogenase/reductase, partial [Candidatus Solibacter sp.]|nr:short-chain dehydrogenase/reductase [Candidatus Solibacter sp.]